MTTPNDLVSPNKYEVLKLKTGQEIVGMTKESQNGIVITLPMICKLELVADRVSTLATFYPYSPMSSDPSVIIPHDMVAHRNLLNQQFVPFYDEASSRWFDMVENGTIPLTQDRKEMHRAYMDRIIHDLMESTGGPISEREQRMLERIEEEEWDEFDETLADFEHMIQPTDKKKIH